MAPKRPARRLKSDFTLGGEAAESDTLLDRAFFESGQAKLATSRSDRRCFMIGRTGGGKSAILKHLADTVPDHVIRIDPESLSLPYIADLDAVRHLASLNVHLDPFFVALWKHVLLVEIIKHKYKVDSLAAKQTMFSALFERVKRDGSKKAALEYLDKYEDRFWCESHERVRDITRVFEEQVNGALKASLSVPTVGEIGADVGSSTAMSTEVKVSLVNKFQRIVNESQLSSLNKMIEVLDDDILSSPQDFTYVIIDDLDRDWVDEKVANDLIRCLFRTVVDLQKVRNLKVVVALRTNIFEELDFGSRTGGQEEKLRALCVQVRWTPQELRELMDERARASAKSYGFADVDGLASLLPNPNKTRGNAFDHILERTLLRPRDAIAFLNECFSSATGKTRLTWDEINGAEVGYSNKRLLALRDEWKPTFPGIQSVFAVFKGYPAVMSTEAFCDRLIEAATLVSDIDYPGVVWMSELAGPIWASPAGTGWLDMYQPLLRLLYQIGFIGFGTGASEHFVYSYDDHEFADRQSNLAALANVAVHRAFRSALDMTTPNAHAAKADGVPE